MPPSREGQDLLDAIALDLQDHGPVAVGTMFHSPALRTGKKVVAFLGSDSGDSLILKLPRARALALVAEGTAAPVTIGKRTMREWVEVPAAADSEMTRTAWTALAREALLYVRSLPASNSSHRSLGPPAGGRRITLGWAHDFLDFRSVRRRFR